MSALFRRFRKHRIMWLALCMLLVTYYFCLPRTLFTDPYSTVISSNTGVLLGAQIANDGRWRFPETNVTRKV